jgi:hypothetical protein
MKFKADERLETACKSVGWREAKAPWNDLMTGEYGKSSIGKQLPEKGLVK